VRLKRRRAAALLVVGILAGLSVGEVAVRLSGVAPPPFKLLRSEGLMPDPVLPYRMRPGYSQRERSNSGEFTVQVKYSSAGLRDVERPVAKPADTFRIIAVGDSFTKGVGAPFKDSWPAVLERRLNARSGERPRVDMIKAGIGGFFPEPERQFLEQSGMAYTPDLLLVGFHESDMADTYLGAGAIKVTGGLLGDSVSRRLRRLAIVIHKYSHLVRVLGPRSGRKEVEAALANFDPEDNAVWRKIEAEYDRMKALFPGERRMALVDIPMGGGGAAPPSYLWRLRRYASDRGILFIDAGPALKKAARQAPTHWPIDGHCTPHGYGAVAGAVYDALVREGMVP
jgi:hypothetical protein